jgi:tellurite resistance protein
MQADQIRSTQDKRLFQQLLEDPSVIRMNEAIAKHESQGIMGTRRQLLSTSVQLSKSMASSVHKIAEDCIEALGVEIPTELYVYNSPQFNAACVKPEEGRLFIMFSSSLLEGFNQEELRFVMGHELGHYVYQHHDIPIGHLMNRQARPSPNLALTLTSWSRYAEFSADRAGAHCTQNFETVASALFKLSSGLTGSLIQFNAKDFLKQVEEMQLEDNEPGVRSKSQDWFMTHPFSPLRVKALQLFHQSSFVNQPIIADPISSQDLEVGISGLMSFMEPAYLEGHTDVDKYMTRLLFAGCLVIANASNGISPQEIELFEGFFGKHKYKESFNIDSLIDELPKRAEQVKESTSTPKRMQVLRDLCLMAKADDKSSDAEKKVLLDIAKLLEIPESFIEQSLSDEKLLD